MPTQVLPRSRPARSLGWGSSETSRSRGATTGFPDSYLIRAGEPQPLDHLKRLNRRSSMHNLKSTTRAWGKNRGSVLDSSWST